MKSPIKIPSIILKTKHVLLETFRELSPERIKNLEKVANEIAINYNELSKEEMNQIANRIEKRSIKAIERKLDLLTEEFRKLLVLKHVIKEKIAMFEDRVDKDIAKAFLASVNKEIRRLLKRISEEKMKQVAIREHGLLKHQESLLPCVIPLLILGVFMVKRWLEK